MAPTNRSRPSRGKSGPGFPKTGKVRETPAGGTSALPALICLTGTDGCGKSTHLKLIADWLSEEFGLPAVPVSVWEITRNPRYHSHPFISDREAIHRYLGSLEKGPRALFVFHALMEALERADPKGGILLADGYWYKYAFTEALHGESLEWLQNVAERFPKPSRTILLDLPPGEAWSRKPKVTPYECGFAAPSEKTFLEFQARLRALFLDRAQKEGWDIVPADRPTVETARVLRELLGPLFKEPAISEQIPPR